MSHTPSHPGTQLMQQVRAAFILKGTSFTAWCRSQSIDASLVRQAVYGTWAGPKGQAMKKKVLAAAGVRRAA